MAHLPPNTAIFSPSVARAAASVAKDWSFVDSWLHTKFHSVGRSPPPFERNADTLRVLLALASANETADEERLLVSRLEATALQELQSQDQARQHRDSKDEDATPTASDAREAILASVRDNLSREGTAALDAMAVLAVNLGLAFATPANLGRRMTDLAGHLNELEQTEARVQVLARYLEGEVRKAGQLADELREDGYRPANDLAKQNLEAQRRIKSIAARLPDLREKAAALAGSVGTSGLSIEQVRREEEAYLALLTQKKELDTQVKLFQGLPHDTDQARQELENLRDDLRCITQRRDAVFEGLVERETPRKPTRRS
ncbi:hypothetical protein B0T25DRAFT_274022 [Lasiosphaeria hispida]|uniref:HAUS augmin-like complex subunit 1 n=1 Tax=Lasiosphaeria hispida TaxID=260671 RepID=A0AAJ0MAL3_9PEZI|nr:hypothetical protein B0T25DRAFT_274022 [Lasiosphaeria hispida]